MNARQFEQIPTRMKRQFGSFPIADERIYFHMLLSMEGNVLRVNRRNPAANTMRLMEAINLVLFTLSDRMESKHTDVSNFENPENLQLKHALMSAFDPLTNEAILPKLTEAAGEPELTDPDYLLRLYVNPIRCILHLRRIVETQIRRKGSDGFFQYLYEYIGDRVPHDEIMNWAIMLLR